MTSQNIPADDRTTSGPPRESVFRIAVASFAGTTIEFFDYYAYGLAAALVLNKAFFPDLSPAAGTLAAFATFGVAFVARPVGAALFGHWGDRIGRKKILVVSLLMMGLATFAVGLLPSFATIGLWAPILLVVLRIIQGIGLGGEWGGAALIATEHAPEGKRGLYAMFPQLGPAIGFILANLTFLACRVSMSDHAFNTIGWRIPFLVSFVLVLVGLYVRLKIAETPIFKEATANHEIVRAPLVELVKNQWKALLLGAGGMIIQYTLFYTATTFCLAYATTTLGVKQSTMLVIVMLAVVMLGVATVFSSILSDRIGRKRVLLISCGLAVVWGLATFPLLDTGNYVLMWLALAGCLALMGLGFGPMGAFLPELFETRYRYTGASLSYSLGGVFGGALPPLIATELSANFSSWTIGAMISVLALISLVCILGLPETKSSSMLARASR
ncbi:MFS transporter [Spelaeicoccus albus]|uniref:Putative proline/betaine transporter n=1 Tax=Spelaeicoccus albus TaxID=1280376 RepID=A0A7Z0ADC1_9MICO|nr:MFS transporter [Spelaeicoccus albus]NYI67416.1 metabolite-proton symporter [Spelaeicoccus albus]